MTGDPLSSGTRSLRRTAYSIRRLGRAPVRLRAIALAAAPPDVARARWRRSSHDRWGSSVVPSRLLQQCNVAAARGRFSGDAGMGGSALRGDAALGSGFRMGQRQLALAVRAALMLVSVTRLHSVGIARDIFPAALFVRVQRRIRKGLLAGFGLAICIRLELCPRVVGTCPTEYSLAGQATQPEVGAPTLSRSDGPGAA
jgi:hypothetical protein